MNKDELLFSSNDLRRLIFPLIIEQALGVTIGMADAMMVSNVGEAAISGINLVDSINNLLIGIFNALATGGTIIVSQYLGHRERDNANHAAKQLLYAIAMIASMLMVVTMIGNRWILNVVYQDLEADVMKNAMTYFSISALSYPFLGIYGSGAALFRAQGNSKISMYTSMIVNCVNISFNALFIYGFKWGVAGAGLATLIARTTAAVVVMIRLHDDHNKVYVKNILKSRPQWSVIKRILCVGIPTGLENGIFHIGKILVAAQVAGFGTAAIAANAVAGNLGSFQCIPGNGINLSVITVVGHCVGADRYDQARYYTRKLFRYAYGVLIIWNLVMGALYSPILSLYNLMPETEKMALILVIIHGIATCTLWAPSFMMPNVLKGAGDVRYTMVISAGSMWVFRILLCMVFGRYTNWGIYGVWAAMMIDWVARGVSFVGRYCTNKWYNKKAI